MDILTVLKEKYPEMTKKQKQITDYMIANPERMTFITLKELSQETQVSEMTILKACTWLEYSNFNEVKYEFRKYVSASRQQELHAGNDYTTTGVPEYELQNKEALLGKIASDELEAMRGMVQNIDLSEIQAAAQEIIRSECVLICGRGISLLLAQALAIGLSSTGIGSVVMNTELNDSIHSLLPMIKENTTVIPISFPDYYFMTTKIAEYSRKCNADIIGITNSRQGDIVPFCDRALLSPSSTRLLLNTMSTPMALINLLSSAVEIEHSAYKKRALAEKKFADLFAENPDHSE